MDSKELLFQIKQLSDYPDQIEIDNYFNILIKNSITDLESAFISMWELSDRQWHTYEMIRYEIKIKIEKWIIKNIDFRNKKIISRACGIIGMLGLNESFEWLKKNKGETVDEIKKEIEDFINEVSDSVDNPYSGM